MTCKHFSDIDFLLHSCLVIHDILFFHFCRVITSYILSKCYNNWIKNKTIYNLYSPQ